MVGKNRSEDGRMSGVLTMELFIKDFFSLVNMGLLLYLLTVNREKSPKSVKTPKALKAACFLLFVGIRFVENWFGTHIAWVYFTVFVMSAVLGYVWERHMVRYSLLIAGAFLSVAALGWISGAIISLTQIAGRNSFVYEIKNKIPLLVIVEITIIIGVFCISRIVRKIPLIISEKSFLTTMLSLITYMIFLSLIGDDYYNNVIASSYTGSGVYGFTTIAAFVLIPMCGTIGSISMLESYLNVKYIENEKNLRLTEMNLQYDYYVRLEKDMEQVKSLSHDIRNHLEALRGSGNEREKVEYIESIESRLERFESHYRTGNTFIDSLLRKKKQEAAELDIPFQVVVDLRPFQRLRDEDLCVMIANAVDNALRECSLLLEEEPEAECMVRLKAGKTREFLSVVCENSIREGQAERLREEAGMSTTKEDQKHHGYGIKNIETAVHKYDGEISIAVYDRMFCLSIIIPV